MIFHCLFVFQLLFVSIAFFNLVHALNPVPIGKYPFAVQIVVVPENIENTEAEAILNNCTGTIIHPRYVLTALTCLLVDGELANVNNTHVIYATNRPNIATHINRVDIEKIYFNVPSSLENFTNSEDEHFIAKHNIAIIQVASEFPTNNNVNSTVINKRTTPYGDHIEAIVIGFGGIDSDGEHNQLREYECEMADFSDDAAPISMHNSSKIRNGEIGGPLLVEDSGIVKQYGIASHNHESNCKLTPIFGKIGQHCEWIQTVTNDLVKCE